MSVLDPRLTTLSAVLDLVRTGRAATRPELETLTGLGRKLVAQRVGELIEAGLLREDSFGPSTGGRAPRRLRFAADAGCLLVAHYGATGVGVGIADLSGAVVDLVHRDHHIADGPEPALALAVDLWEMLLERRAQKPPVWGVGIGVPGPVEFSTARPVSPPIMPGWHEFDIRDRVHQRFEVPVWVDNDVNAMALGELRAGEARGVQDFLYLKIGSGIGAGLVSRGSLHRGAQGVAGDVGHTATREQRGVICRCGKTDCLEAVAGGAALIASAGRSGILARRLAERGRLAVDDLRYAAEHGDPEIIALLTRSGRLVGEMLASVVNLFNPSLVIVGGHVAEVGDALLAGVRQTVYERSLPLATRDLRIVRSMHSDVVGVTGSAFTAIDELFAPAALSQWMDRGSPAGLRSL
ncbi:MULTISPECIES: ROK family protein [Actinoplanes]|uniref:ROK family protein n=1 Tax=Actinoplanes TaxID=1865 RepID=UPI0005F29FBC|nr:MULTISPECIES: ROK family protein [Actinoplanes]